MNKAYEVSKIAVMKSLETIPNVRGTSATEYLAALEEIQGEVEAWFEASIAAASDDAKVGR